MEFLTALGFLGLIGIAVLILIYVLKPNYQKRFISSTFVWKLSLKYKKKRIPINRFRNILIFICQILLITISAFILAQPFISIAAQPKQDAQILIIDASANMQAFNDYDVSRFERAVAQAKIDGKDLITKNQGQITVILAGYEAAFVIVRTDKTAELDEALDKLILPNKSACTFGVADIDGAMALAETILAANRDAEVRFYTATKYAAKGDVVVVDVSEPSEWNAAILNVTPVLDGMLNDDGEIVGENFYIFNVEIACYGRNIPLTVYFKAYGVNWDSSTVELQETHNLTNDKAVVINFQTEIYSYESVNVWIDADDSFSHDNSFYIYGGKKEKITIEYVSQFRADHPDPKLRNQPAHNVFVNGALLVLRQLLASQWNIVIKETSLTNFEPGNADFYIFEHSMPQNLPFDGVVFIIDPAIAPDNLQVNFGREVDSSDVSGVDDFVFFAERTHPLLDKVNLENIAVTRYREILGYGEGFEEIMSGPGGATLLVKNNTEQKIAVLPFDIHRSTIALNSEWVILVRNLFNFFIPPTITEVVYEVNDKVGLNARGASLTVFNPNGESTVFESFPSELFLPWRGVYTLRQELLSGDMVTENFYAKIDKNESDFSRIEPILKNPSRPPEPPPISNDLLIYFAIALVALLLIERLLYARDFS